MIWRIESAHLEQAVRVVSAHASRTDLVAAPALGDGVFLKLESAQDTGSFKLRGALAALGALDEEGRDRGVLTASAGNHGYGMARAGALLGVPVTVVVATSVPAVKRRGIEAAGATLELVEASGYDEVEAYARSAALARGLRFVSPFDDPLVAAGNGGTVGLEILEQRPDLETLVAPVGGGGLIAGLAAARRHAAASFALVGVQSEACPSMRESLDANRALLSYVGAPTLAEGLEGGVSESTFAVARDELARMEVVSEREIEAAMRFAKRELGLTIEGSAAVVIAWLRRRLPEVATPVVAVISGRNVDPAVLERILSS